MGELLKWFHKLFQISLLVFSTHGAQCAEPKCEYQYGVGICAMFRNEADVLEEWLEYHLMLGVEHFWLYNEESDDDYLPILEPYIEAGVVDLFQRKRDECLRIGQRQTICFCETLRLAYGIAKWVAFIDMDEFILPHHVDSLPELLAPYEQQGMGVTLPWEIFGTSGYYDLPKGGTFTECFVLKIPSGSNHARRCPKGIIQPMKVPPSLRDPKHFSKGERRLVHWYGFEGHPASKRLRFPKQYCLVPIAIEKAQLNHYWTKTERYFREVKWPWKQKVAEFKGKKHSEEELIKIREEFNQEEDYCIRRFVPELKRRLGRDEGVKR